MKFTDTAAVAAIAIGATVGGFLAITTLAPTSPDVVLEQPTSTSVEVEQDADQAVDVAPLAATVDELALTPDAWVAPPQHSSAEPEPDVADDVEPEAAGGTQDDGDTGTAPAPPPSTPEPSPDPSPSPAPAPAPAPPVEEDRVPEYNDRGEPIPPEPPLPPDEPEDQVPDDPPEVFPGWDGD